MFWQYTAAAMRQMPAETAHLMAVKAMQMHLVPQVSVPAGKALATRLCGLDFTHPVGLAAGFDKNAQTMGGAFKMGLSHIEVGTITPKPQPGNPRPRVFRLSQDKAVINRYGFNSQGMDKAFDRLNRYRRNARGSGIIGVNIGANKLSEDKPADYYHTALKLAPVADYLTVNISSPNTAGLRELQHADQLKATLDAAKAGMAESSTSCPLFVKLAPDLSQDELNASLDLTAQAGVDGVILTNTTLARPDTLRSADKTEQGGLSGAPLHDRALQILQWAVAWRSTTQHQLHFIGVGGISTAEQAYMRLLMGAELIQLYTALALQGPVLVQQILSRLSVLAAADGADLNQITGQIPDAEHAHLHTQQLLKNGTG